MQLALDSFSTSKQGGRLVKGCPSFAFGFIRKRMILRSTLHSTPNDIQSIETQQIVAV